MNPPVAANSTADGAGLPSQGSQVPVADHLFTWPATEPRLLAARCEACGAVTFPVQEACPRCTARDMQATELPSRGILWTWTIQGFPPKAPYRGPQSPELFEPYGVGYVEIGREVLVETRLTVNDPRSLHIGMDMQLVFLPLGLDENKREVVTYAFQPVP